MVVDPDVDQIHCGLIRLLHLKSRWREMGLDAGGGMLSLIFDGRQLLKRHYSTTARSSGHSGDKTCVPVLPRAPEISPAVPVL